MKQETEIYLTKLLLFVGTGFGALTLNDWDLILSISLKCVSIISFTTVIALNAEKLYKKIKDWSK